MLEDSAWLHALTEKIGFLPNVFSVMGGTPEVLSAFVAMNQNFGQSSLTAVEREIVQIAVSVENRGTYCVAGHTSFAKKQSVDDEIVVAVRARGILSDPKLAALHEFSRRVAIKRGNLKDGDVERFVAAGYSKEQVL